MRTIRFDPTKLSTEARKEWSNWTRRAKKATQDLANAWLKGHDPRLSEGLWQQWRDLVNRELFHRRCAYCEASFDQARHKPHAEHYRPKLKVTFERPHGAPTPNAKARDRDGSEVDHKGYFWLAYDWINIVPSCAHCNTEGGKDNQFPVAERHSFVETVTTATDALGEDALEEATLVDRSQDIVLLSSEQLNLLERPLLLNPLVHNPEEHLCFDEFGGIHAKKTNRETPSATMSIAVYRLDEKEIERARQAAQREGRARWNNTYSHYLEKYSADEAWSKALEFWRRKSHEEGSSFPSAVEAYIQIANPRPDSG